MRRWKIVLSIILGVAIIGLLGVKGFQKMELTKEEEQRKEIYRIEKLIAEDVAINYEGIHEISFIDYNFFKSGDEYMGFGIKLNNKKRVYTITYSNDTDFGESGNGDEIIDNFYKRNTNKSLGIKNVKNLKIKYFFDKSK